MIPGNRVLIENPITRNLFRKIILCDFKASLDRGGEGEGMGSLWGECESRREMILSVLSPGHIDIGEKKEGYYVLIYCKVFQGNNIQQNFT